MRYLHLHNILHRDLKLENVLVDENYYPKVCDFGLSICFPETFSRSLKLSLTGQIGTPIYMAPELLKGENYGPGIDVYVFSMLAYEIITNKRPFYELGDDLDFISLRKKVLKGYRPKLTDDIPIKTQELLNKCWSQTIEERLSFDEIFALLSSYGA